MVRRRALKDLASRMPFRPFLRFLYMFVLRAGILDGGAGFHYCRLLAITIIRSCFKTQELKQRGQAPLQETRRLQHTALKSGAPGD